MGWKEKKKKQLDWTFDLGSEQIKPQTGYPSPEAADRGNKFPSLVERPLQQTEGLSKPNSAHEECRHAGWPPREGKERPTLAAVRFPTAASPCALAPAELTVFSPCHNVAVDLGQP